MKVYKIIALLVVCFVFLNVASATIPDRTIRITVQVEQTKANGRKWDGWGGAPDIQVKISSDELGTMSSSEASNTYNSTVTFDIGECRGELKIEIWDIDINTHDLIGKGRIKTNVSKSYQIGQAKVKVKI
ncbi:hypothetical protein KAR48_02040 [bacterium]|nr:hypothetical protein [bacterium]